MMHMDQATIYSGVCEFMLKYKMSYDLVRVCLSVKQ